jgi:hypothetical protein
MTFMKKERKRNMKKVMAVMAGLLLVMAVAAFAQTAKAPKTLEAKGTVVSVDENSLVLDHKVQGKDTKTTFVLNADTKKEGKLAPKGKATVHYKVEGGQNIATMVKEGHGM